MFWILRRTGAANFFNSLNNNNSSKSNFNNNNNNEKNAKRPERKAYGRLSMDSDDAIITTKNKYESDSISSSNKDTNFHLNNKYHSNNSITNHNNNNNNNNNNNQNIMNNNIHMNNNNNNSSSQISDGSYMVDDSNLNLEINQLNDNNSKDKKQLLRLPYEMEVRENQLNRLHAIAMSDDEDYDEALTCNVCDRAFHCHRQLASHQQKKRHFGCSGCDSLFQSLMLLEHHKEEFEHWSDDEDNRRHCCRRNRGDDFTDTDSFTSEAESEDLERLL